MDRYEPSRYWGERLGKDFNLRGTGHLSYSEGYNRWLYRQKARALSEAHAAAGVARDAKCLDIGSGVGWVVAWLLERQRDVEGCDIVPEAVERLAAQFPDARFFEAEIGKTRIPREDDTYDLITVMDVLYHVPDDGLFAAALADITRVLRPSGKLIVTDGLGKQDLTPSEHVRFRSAETWKRASAAAGLEFEAVGPLYRWLSRDRGERVFDRLPGKVRGPIEYALEISGVGQAHMRYAVLTGSAQDDSAG